MKFCQDKIKNNLKSKIKVNLILICLFFCFLFFPYSKLLATVTPNVPIAVEDQAKFQQDAIANAKKEANFWEEFTWTKLQNLLWKQVSGSFKSALGHFLNTIAYDTATYLASGDEGQKPMFYTEGWGTYLTNVGDNAAGTFLETLGREGVFGTKFNLCEPDPAIKIKIGLGLSKTARPKKPECTFTEMKQNWEQALQKESFLNDFQDMFKPWSNDLSIALILQTGFGDEVDKAVEESKLVRETNNGMKDVTDSIGNYIRTPASAVAKRMDLVLEDSTTKEKTYTGTVFDAIEVFYSTLVGKLFQEWFDKGLVNRSTDNSYKGNWGGFEEDAARGGIAEARERFRNLVEPEFSVRGDYKILGELATCPDPRNAGPTNCVITENFRQAIENRMTVGEAMKDGYLKASGIFGFKAGDNLEPNYYDGDFPYRSMIILRKFRILPVGWEIAAQYIKDNYDSGSITLNDMVNCFSNTDDYEGYYEGWCDGLVDPNWVLKAPLNYCKREGSGPEIIYRTVIGEGYDSELSVVRNDNYCADEQTCVKENGDGSCEAYGYCTEERKTWNFNANSCDPKYNTCQTFRSSDGKTVSYLENTLEYCASDGAGCLNYCTDYDVSSGWGCEAGSSDELYLNNKAQECGAEDEGCSELIRTKAGLGANLIKNSSFEDFEGSPDDSINDEFSQWGDIGEAVSEARSGFYGLNISSDLNYKVAIGAYNYTTAGEIFTLSFYSENCSGDFWLGAEDNKIDISDEDGWQRNTISYVYPLNSYENGVRFMIHAEGSCYIDDIKLEKGKSATAYSDYHNQGVIYEKLIPSYLEDDCYIGGNNYQLKASAPEICKSFARKCNEQEEGCELYTSVSEGFSVPAKVTAQDYCPEECINYDTYIQSETIFDSLRDSYFIPSTADNCSAESVGCDEFTNLDEIELGGEAIEYYSYLRQCIKPGSAGAVCDEFYTWEGSDESGYQLRVFNLKSEGQEPALTEDDSSLCSEDIYELSSDSPAYNPDCRQFYSQSGYLSYHLYTRTISCSDNCHPYRRAMVNTDPSITQANCVGEEKHWNGYECAVCKNGGVWNSEHQSCIYMAVPREGISCSASQAGCREYSGNKGNNMRAILVSDFESGETQGWNGVNTNIAPSSESLQVGGGSLNIIDGDYHINISLGTLVTKGSNYVLSFLAKSSSANKISDIYFANENGEKASFTTVDLSNDWIFYKVNLIDGVGHEVDGSETLNIISNGSFYIDDIRLVEITDRYYLIKGSWNTPESCDRDWNGNPYPLYMLGCDAYYDQNDDIHNLRSFNELCQESAVGCELMVDTHNSTAFESEIFNEGNPNEIIVGQDEFIYAVYDFNKICSNTDKGCQRFGMPYHYGNQSIYSEVYLKNNPDIYNEILCDLDQIDCESWSSQDGISYFKNPRDMVCEWRAAGEEKWGWFKKKIKRCDADGSGLINGDEDTICLVDSDCSIGACILDNNDYECDIGSMQTFGYGGYGNRVYQPTGGWAGICPASESGCTEYIDPISQPSINTIFNSNCSDIDGNGTFCDGWLSGGIQELEIKPYTLYVFDIEGNGQAEISCDNAIYNIGSNNIPVSVNSILVDDNDSAQFYSGNNEVCEISGGEDGKNIELKRIMIDYQLKQEINTSEYLVNQDEGLILFNQRSISGLSGYNNLDRDADTSPNANGTWSTCAGDNEKCDSNSLIKVSPDRVCNSWMACRSYVEDESGNNVCFDIGLCDSFDDNGNCSNFIVTNKENQTYPSLITAEQANSYSGYSKTGHAGSDSFDMPNDLYHMGAMDQFGEIVYLPNGGFEYSGENNYPLGWNVEMNEEWDKNNFKAIDNPIEAQSEGICFRRESSGNCELYAPEGKNILKSGSTFKALSEYIDVIPGADYMLTAYINTVNLSAGSAKISVIGNIDNETEIASIALSASNDWTFKLSKFNVLNSTQIKIKLYADNNPNGNFYFDDIKIKPALEVKDMGAGEWYVNQSCRLYPENNSLSCDYYSDSGKRQKGWLGYCLEYDRYPGSKDACLLWYPLDKIKGDGIEEGAGYQGRFPLYYCVGLKGEVVQTDESLSGCGNTYYYNRADLVCTKLVQTVSSVGQNKYWAGRVYEGSDYKLSGSDNFYIKWDTYGDGALDIDGLVYNTDKNPFGSMYPPYPAHNPYEWDSVADTEDLQANEPVYVKKPITGTEIRAGFPYIGLEFEYYYIGVSIRSGSVTIKPCERCSGFGPSYDPEHCSGSLSQNADGSWNHSCTCDNSVNHCTVSCYNTLEVNSYDNESMAENAIKRIFAQSYSAWEWQEKICNASSTRANLICKEDDDCPDGDGIGLCEDNKNKKYVLASPVCYGGLNEGLYCESDSDCGGGDCRVIGWGPPAIVCSGSSRPDYPNDYCAVLPQINNIKVNDNNEIIEVRKNGFVNLTFSSEVDDEQEPLVLYAVDWGDNEITSVSGVEMRDRPQNYIESENNPHSLYHLYSYWDLKVKAANGVYGVDHWIDCDYAEDACRVKPKVKIKDNWGWCNGGSAVNDCDQWELFDGWIVIKER